MAGAFPVREFGPLRSQARLAKIAEAKQTDYWAGSTWVYHQVIDNGGEAGDQVYTVTPGEDNEFEVLYGSFENNDTVSRNASVRILDDDDNIISSLLGGTLNFLSITPNDAIQFPEAAIVNTTRGTAAGTRFIVSGDMKLEAEMRLVAIGQESRFAVACRVRGEKPQVTLQGGGAFVVSEQKDLFF